VGPTGAADICPIMPKSTDETSASRGEADAAPVAALLF
jgi:hypothetical protein